MGLGDACATRRAAGLHTIQADLTDLKPPDHRIDGLLASPPCPAFSAAGTQSGREHLETLVEAVRSRNWDARPGDDPLVWLPLRVGAWVEAGRPDWIVAEQVPAVLPVWQAYCETLDAMDYSTWTGVLDAADYGVPQNRRRAFLLASRSRIVSPPEQTHRREGGYPFKRWISMREIIDVDGFVGFPRRADRQGSITIDGVEYRARDLRSTDLPSFTLTEKARSWSVFARHERRPLTLAEATKLQTFPSDYPWQGSRTSQFHQVGDAVPPLLAEQLIACVI